MALPKMLGSDLWPLFQWKISPFTRNHDDPSASSSVFFTAKLSRVIMRLVPPWCRYFSFERSTFPAPAPLTNSSSDITTGFSFFFFCSVPFPVILMASNPSTWAWRQEVKIWTSPIYASFHAISCYRHKTMCLLPHQKKPSSKFVQAKVTPTLWSCMSQDYMVVAMTCFSQDLQPWYLTLNFSFFTTATFSFLLSSNAAYLVIETHISINHYSHSLLDRSRLLHLSYHRRKEHLGIIYSLTCKSLWNWLNTN